VRLFDSLRNAVHELVIPSAGERPLKLYVCGVTPYDTTHIGHLRTFMIFDVLIRYVQRMGGVVRYCRNVTDVDDPLFERAKRNELDWKSLAERETIKFAQDCNDFNLIAPDFVPRVSEEIEQMFPIIETLVRKGHAYVTQNGNVYFSWRSASAYGQMVKDRLPTYADMLRDANEHGNDPNDPRKKDPLDFVLWRESNPGEPAWNSPWGPGRPGWHIECTAMAIRYLGQQLDVHGGGRDLTFPHHPSEIAQSEAYTGLPFANFWVHGGLASLEGEKMSKSLGNLVFARQALQHHSANALRWYLLSFPYRQDFDYKTHEVIATEAKAQRLREALEAANGTSSPLDLSPGRDEILAMLDDDLQYHRALPVLEQMIKATLDAAADRRDIKPAQDCLRDAASVLGLQLSTSWPRFS
jgi:L-cysteine:1D-myo-inositol 2-amino-2-deoxy-alpha-D-glucopyranoside ligase